MVELQLARLDSALALGARRAGHLDLSPQDLVTLASIIEGEAQVEVEHPACRLWQGTVDLVPGQTTVCEPKTARLPQKLIRIMGRLADVW